MAHLKYPLDLDEGSNDFIKFTHFEYSKKDNYQMASRPLRDAGSSIKLYMPNSTPSTQYGHEATYQTFPGPLGNLGKQFLTAMGKDFSGGVQDATTKLQQGFNDLKNDTNIGGAAYQFFLDKAAGVFGADAATAIAMGQGKSYNPNAEMIYKQPYHRKYDFSFDFTPKSREEAAVVDKIIYEFKKWSAPAYDEGPSSGFMKIPHLWQASYHEANGKVYRRMNLFKPALITNFAAQDNPNSDFHMTIKDDEAGHVPVHTTIKLMLQETMPPTREDHDKAVGMGHLRGF